MAEIQQSPRPSARRRTRQTRSNKASLQRLKFYVPIRLGSGFDCTYFSHGSASQRAAHLESFSRLLHALNESDAAFEWTGPRGTLIAPQRLLAFENGRAPSERPFYAIRAVPRGPIEVSGAAAAAKLPIVQATMQCLFQDFGVAVAEYDLVFQGPCEPAPGEYDDKINAVETWLKTEQLPQLLAGCDRLTAKAVEVGIADAPLYRIRELDALKDGATEAPAEAYWVHRFSQWCAGREICPELLAWRRAFVADGFAPLSGHPIDAVIAVRAATYVPLHGRLYDADVVIGWGNSLSVTTGDISCEMIDKAVPLEIAFNLSQAFSALLYSVNKTSLELSTLFLHQRSGFGERRTRPLIDALAGMQARLRASIALLNEQRYCLAAAEQKIWDASFREWGNDRLIQDVRQNLVELRKMLDEHAGDLQERRSRRLTFAIFLVTMFSAAAVIFNLFPNLLLSREPSRMELWLQLGTISFLVLSSLTLALFRFRRRRKRRKR